jgi:hypothetical protein
MTNKKILSFACILIFILSAIPIVNAEETNEAPLPLFDKMSLAHIKIDGSGSSFIIAGEFILGFGRCAYMRFKLEEESHIEINKFLDQSNIITLDGSHTVTIFGFVGYYKETDTDITINGFATLVYWR